MAEPDSVQHRIYERRIIRELGEIFGPSEGHEREISPGLFALTLCDTSDGSIRKIVDEPSIDKDLHQRHQYHRRRRRTISEPSAIIGLSYYIGHSLASVDNISFNETSSANLFDSTFVQENFDVLRELTSTPHVVIRWSPDTQSFKAASSKCQVVINSSPGIRLVLKFTQEYFRSWGITISQQLLETSQNSQSIKLRQETLSYQSTDGQFESSVYDTQSTSTIPTDISELMDSAVVCIAVIEIPITYPMSYPCICIPHFGVQQHLDWYHLLFTWNSSIRYSLSQQTDNDQHVPQQQSSINSFFVRDALPLTRLSSYRLTHLVLGESWTPGISLNALITRLSAVIREQVIAHAYYFERNPIPNSEDTRFQSQRISVPEIEMKGIDSNMQRSSSSIIDPLINYSSRSVYPNNFTRSDYPWLSLWSVLLISITLRIIIGNQPHSGQFNSPIYGDYEAQRHWKEITVHRPINEWYSNIDYLDGQNETIPSSHYWNLDYPPLTAFHEYIMGHISQWLEPESITNTIESRGYLTLSHKLFMRCSVILSDLIVFHTAAIFFWCFLPDEFLVST